MTRIAISNILIYIHLLTFPVTYLVIVNDFFFLSIDTNGSQFITQMVLDLFNQMHA